MTSQLVSKENIGYEEANKMATAILVKRGHLNKDGTTTFAGAVRGSMTAEERAADRNRRYVYKKKRKI